MTLQAREMGRVVVNRVRNHELANRFVWIAYEKKTYKGLENAGTYCRCD